MFLPLTITKLYKLRLRLLKTDLTLQKNPQHTKMVAALEMLGPDGMSDDEDDTSSGPPGNHRAQANVRRILEPDWRSAAVTAWLRSLDAYEHDRSLALAQVRSRRGPVPAVRLPGNQVHTRRLIPRGLHPNAYRYTWLERQPRGAHQIYEMNSSAFNFEEVLVYRS